MTSNELNTRTIISCGFINSTTSDYFVYKGKGLNWTVETHSVQPLRLSVIRSEHNETTQTFEPAAI